MKKSPRKSKPKLKPKSAAPQTPVNYRWVVAAAAIAVAIFWIFYPTYQIKVQQQAELAGLKRELVRARRQNLELLKRIKELKSSEYVERYAREKMGLVKPGEKAYVVLPPSKSKPTTKTPARPPKPEPSLEPTGTWESIKSFLSRLFSNQ